MKNCVLKGVLALSLASSFALAEGGFAGVEGGYDFSSKLTSGGSIKDNRPNIGIKGGYDFDTARVYGGYFYHAKAKDSYSNIVDAKWTNHKFVIGGDYTPTIADNFKLVAGLYTGLSVINFDATANTNAGRLIYDVTKSGWLFGAKLGGEYSFDKNNALEFGLKTDKTWYPSAYNLDFKSTDVGAYLGYTYKF